MGEMRNTGTGLPISTRGTGTETMNHDDATDKLLEGILVDAYGEDEQLWAFRQEIEDDVPLPVEGTVIGELSLGKDFEGVLPRGLIDNRPYLRCLHGYGLCLWRLNRFDEAAAVFTRMLWLNPSDNQGARFNLNAIRDGQRWTR